MILCQSTVQYYVKHPTERKLMTMCRLLGTPAVQERELQWLIGAKHDLISHEKINLVWFGTLQPRYDINSRVRCGDYDARFLIIPSEIGIWVWRGSPCKLLPNHPSDHDSLFPPDCRLQFHHPSSLSWPPCWLMNFMTLSQWVMFHILSKSFLYFLLLGMAPMILLIHPWMMSYCE